MRNFNLILHMREIHGRGFGLQALDLGESNLMLEHTLYTNVLINLVSKMYPRGIQFRKRRRVSRVAWTRGAFWEFS